MKATKISLTDFTFKPSGYGNYFVEYQSPVTGKKFSCITNNMPLVDLTKNADYQPKVKDLNELKRMCKN